MTTSQGRFQQAKLRTITPLPVEFRPAGPDVFAGLKTLRGLILPDLHIPLGPEQKRMLLASRRFLDAHDWLMLLGDVTACYGTPGEYREAAGFIRRLKRPYSVVNGNHEFSFEVIGDDDKEYGAAWRPASCEEGRHQLAKFEQFYGLSKRFQVLRHRLATILLLGVDNIESDSSARLWHDNEAWLTQQLDAAADRPLLVMCHFPLSDRRLDNARYYDPGRRPYYIPSPPVHERLERRCSPTFWFSGHVHFMPGHPLSQPYLTSTGAWQIHCPDGWGFGRPDLEEWLPTRYEGLYVRSFHLLHDRLTISTTDVASGRAISTWSHPLPPVRLGDGSGPRIG